MKESARMLLHYATGLGIAIAGGVHLFTVFVAGPYVQNLAFGGGADVQDDYNMWVTASAPRWPDPSAHRLIDRSDGINAPPTGWWASVTGAAKIFKLKMGEAAKTGKHAISVYFKDNSAAFLTLKDEKTMLDLLPGERSKTWKTLDVNVLHVLILEKFFGIDAEKLALQINVKYYRGIEEGLEKLAAHPSGNALFVMNATKVSEVEKVALAGERMPQKSTDFFPKLIDGLVFNKIMFTGWGKDEDEFYRM